MGDEVAVTLERDVYFPGEVISGTVECHFPKETKINGIRIKMKGKASVHWTEGRFGDYSAKETYFRDKFDLLEACLMQGRHQYPFSFNLPLDLPSSLTHEHGEVAYKVQAKVVKPWSMNTSAEKRFTVVSFLDLNALDVQDAVEITTIKHPFTFTHKGPLALTIQLPATGFTPAETIFLKVWVRNNSRVIAEKLKFYLYQGFVVFAQYNSRVFDHCIGKKYVISDKIFPCEERCWVVQMEVPQNVYSGNITTCRVMKTFAELRAKVVLPKPHSNMKIAIPLTFGNVPLATHNF